ncbi:DHS-like NAD/FAD-binding domain-containing protein [Colletotrichum eremochloae]|nr:DHS-like NAD/FAD-binding domain-containing protein [Colletotrichum eremochloae]
MANTAPKVAEQERRELASIVDEKAQDLVDQIKRSKHFIVFTGAGISTSAGIPDFRGPEGAWTLRAQGRKRTEKTVSTLQAVSTKTHMALVELQNRGILKYLVSQNCDGLHRKSGILPEKISELHGNSNREYCKDCGKEYIRVDFRAVATYEKTVHDHRTGRKCAVCGGVLLDTIVNFGEYLPAEPLRLAREHARKADLCLALGSSLTVPPACTIPEAVGSKRKTKRGDGGRLVVCNLQSTPLDHLSELRVWAEADDLMARVMRKLGLEIPGFVLRRRLVVEVDPAAGSGQARFQVSVRGIDVDGTPATFLRSVRMEGNRRAAKAEPFAIPFRAEAEGWMEVKLELEFMGHYGEPNLEIVQEYGGEGKLEAAYLLEYDPSDGEWRSCSLLQRPLGPVAKR